MTRVLCLRGGRQRTRYLFFFSVLHVCLTYQRFKISGEDARKFKNQLRYGRPKQAAKAAAVRGKVMMGHFQKKGYVMVRAAKKAK